LSTPKNAVLANEKKFSLSLNTSLQSHANDAENKHELLILDGEVHRFDTMLTLSFAARWSASVQAGLVRNSAGDLDSLISNWHAAFGLPKGDRARFLQDQFLFIYQFGERGLALNQSVSGLGEIELSLAYQLLSNAGIAASAHAILSLPTGEQADLTGSSKADAGLILALASNRGSSLGWHANLGAHWIGDDSLYKIETADTFWAASIGLHWQANRK
jgi:PIN domain nuclease of toxin-antitoxin system